MQGGTGGEFDVPLDTHADLEKQDDPACPGRGGYRAVQVDADGISRSESHNLAVMAPSSRQEFDRRLLRDLDLFTIHRPGWLFRRNVVPLRVRFLVTLLCARFPQHFLLLS